MVAVFFILQFEFELFAFGRGYLNTLYGLFDRVYLVVYQVVVLRQRADGVASCRNVFLDMIDAIAFIQNFRKKIRGPRKKKAS